MIDFELRPQIAILQQLSNRPISGGALQGSQSVNRRF
jgi:hypothetical protein